jgi:RimJ/RimL family protein N-acetyltransferase
VSERLKSALENISAITSVDHISIASRMIRDTTIKTHSLENLRISQLEPTDASNLYEFYYHRLSQRSRELFFPYPLFDTPTSSSQELLDRISEWRRENTWSFLNIHKNDHIIAVGFLKRIDTDFPTSGLAVADDFHRSGLGFILQTLVIEQARLLDIKKLYVKVDPENQASKLLHEKCGYKHWRMASHFGFENGVKVPRTLLELVCDVFPGY